MLETRIRELLEFQSKQKLSWSMRFPFLRPLFVFAKRFLASFQYLKLKLAREYSSYLPFVAVRHQSLLMRKLGESDPLLQKNKIKNIQIAIGHLDWLIIQPWEVFSFWERIWKPSYKEWYLDGMLISGGEVIPGVWGGLCQLSNLLYWMFIHLDIQVLERHRHSFDVFPDSWRVLPFASGATVFYNYVDLKIKNTLSVPLQLKLRTTNQHLKGQILTTQTGIKKYHICEENHTFILYQGKYWRYNQIFKEEKNGEPDFKRIFLLENFSEVKYPITVQKIQELGYSCMVID